MKKIDLEKELDLLRNKVFKLERQVTYAHSELCELSQGIGVKPMWYLASSSWEIAMKHKASMAIQKLFDIAQDS